MKELFFLKNMYSDSIKLDQIIIMSLSQWSLVIVEGSDSTRYLQGQLTNNIYNLNMNNYLFAAHCNSYGKVLSNIIVFMHKRGYAYIQRKNICDIQISELKKYSIFSNVLIYKDNNRCILGIIGNNSNKILKEYFKKIPNQNETIVRLDDTYILWMKKPLERFLIIMSLKEKIKFVNQFRDRIIIKNSTTWELLDIMIGFPIIDQRSCSKFIPQEINLEQFNCIDFKKGCYQGQEIIARYKFRKIKKRKICWIIGTSKIVPLPGELIEANKFDHWSVQGSVLIAIEVKYQTFWIQAVLKSSLTEKNVLRIYNNKSSYFVIKKIFF